MKIGDQFLSFQQKLINTTMAFREEQRKIIEGDHTKTLGEVTTLNLTILEGGVQVNVLPEKFIACQLLSFQSRFSNWDSLFADFDIRVPPTKDFDKFEKEIAGWCQEAGEGVTYEFLQV